MLILCQVCDLQILFLILWVALLLYSQCPFAQKFQVLMKFNPFIFTFVVCAFDVIPRKSLPNAMYEDFPLCFLLRAL